MRLKLLMLLAVIILLTGDIDQKNSTIYKISVNGYDGFHKIVILETGESVLYENHALNINVGDDVVWINDDINDDSITIISEEKLWKNDDAVLKYTGRQFNYTFNDAGIFTFHIKHREKFPGQTIIVSNVTQIPDNINVTPISTVVPIYTEEPVPTDTEEPVPTDTEEPVPTDTEDVHIPATSSPISLPTGTISTNDSNMTDMANDNLISTNPILMPLDILKNLKNVFFLSAVIFILIFLTKK